MKIDWKTGKTDFDYVTNNKGIYLICSKHSDNKVYVDYVGQASDLQKRLREHWSQSETNLNLKNHIKNNGTCFSWYAEVSIQSDRDGIELYLYNYYKPSLNKNTPSANKEVECNLPGK